MSATPSLLAPILPAHLVGRAGDAARNGVLRGLLVHLANPKPILFFTALFAMGMPGGTGAAEPTLLLTPIWVQSLVVFPGFAMVMGARPARAIHDRARPALEILFAAVFGAASLALLVTGLRTLTRG